MRSFLNMTLGELWESPKLWHNVVGGVTLAVVAPIWVVVGLAWEVVSLPVRAWRRINA